MKNDLWQVLRSTWTGRILLLNTIIFFVMAWQSQSIFMPETDVLIKWGAKDPGLLVAGEYWRFITPMFVHIGIIHFAFNSWALYVIGRQIEQLLGGPAFLMVYLISGVVGVIASSLWGLGISAGASGAIFGLLGCGFFVEWKMKKAYERQTGNKMRGGAYASMLFANLVFGALVPQIDNAAHVGGMVAGLALIYILIQVKVRKNDRGALIRAGLVAAALTAFAVVGVWLSTSSTYVLSRVWKRLDALQGDMTESGYIESIQIATIGIEISPTDLKSRLARAERLLQVGENAEGIKDLEVVQTQPEFRAAAHKMAQTLRDNGFKRQAEQVESLGGAN